MLTFIEAKPPMISGVGHTLRTIIIIVVTALDLKAQLFNPRYNFKHLNVQNGLTQNIVYHFLQDSHGYMWIGTHNGLSMYDGFTTTNFLQNEQDSTPERKMGAPGSMQERIHQPIFKTLAMSTT